MPRYRFKFFDGQTFEAYGDTPRGALKALGLEAYNPAAYDMTEIAAEIVEITPDTPTTE